MKFRKKPVVIDAEFFDGTPSGAVAIFGVFDIPGGKFLPNYDDLSKDCRLLIPTLEGEMTAQPGDWIIRGVQGEFYPVKPEIFAATYDPVVAASLDEETPAQPERQVGCERPDGTLNIHSAAVTCDVCESAAARTEGETS